jgi:hypothetical protein
MTADKKLLHRSEEDIPSISLETRNKYQRRQGLEPTSLQWKDELVLSALQQQNGKSLKTSRKWLCRTLFVEVPQKINSTLED